MSTRRWFSCRNFFRPRSSTTSTLSSEDSTCASKSAGPSCAGESFGADSYFERERDIYRHLIEQLEFLAFEGKTRLGGIKNECALDLSPNPQRKAAKERVAPQGADPPKARSGLAFAVASKKGVEAGK